MKLTLIAAVGKNWAIGNKNQLLWKCPGDLTFFKNYTMGSILIMGRKTWDSLPKKPLPGRVNIVISSNPNLTTDAIVARDPADAMRIARHIQASLDINIAVIGGQQIYEAFADQATDLVLSVVEDSPEADAFFPQVPGRWCVAAIFGTFFTDCGKKVVVSQRSRLEE